MGRGWIVVGVLLATPVTAQTLPRQRTIDVTGSGVVETMTDRATISFQLRGEGTTPDAATQALATKQADVVAGLTGLLGPGAAVSAGDIALVEARDAQCADNQSYNPRPRLSQGACAVTGYVATLQGTVRTTAIDRAGTAAGLASRLGASDARLSGFVLTDDVDARRRAMAAAVADARRQAEAVAAGAGVKLGEIVAVRSPPGFEVSRVVAEDVGAFGERASLAAARSAKAPIRIDVKPRPVETRVQVAVSYAIAP